MRLSHVTYADKTLPHQVIFLSTGNKTVVSCNCLLITDGQGYSSHTSMGETQASLIVARRLYNDPSNHEKAFGKEDEAKW